MGSWAARTARIAAAMALLCLMRLVAALSAQNAGQPSPPAASSADDPIFRDRRLRMVANQIEAEGIKDAAVLQALRTVPRHRFVPASLQSLAYENRALPIGEGQTISQPTVVAMMTEQLHPERSMKVLEVGTGSGYQAAVLAECVGKVYTIELRPALGRRAESTLLALGYRNVHVRIGDGYDGWPEQSPFDAIVLTAAPDRIPQPLVDQLRMGGKLVAPIGGRGLQELLVATKTPSGLQTRIIAPVMFVPMTGKAQKQR